MNRKEAIKVIEENRIQYRDWKQEEFDKAIEKLKEPLTLADFLGWIEDVEYEEEYGDIYKIEDGNLYKIYDSSSKKHVKEILHCDFGYKNINWLRSANKTKPKPKAYHVKDEYSLDELIKELKEQGALVDINLRDDFRKGYIYLFVDDENHINSYTHSRFLEDYDIIEYHKEEPKYYARYKGSVKLYQDYNYYNYLAWKGVCVISDKGEVFNSIIQMTKSEWKKLGINKTNADFEEVR